MQRTRSNRLAPLNERGRSHSVVGLKLNSSTSSSTTSLSAHAQPQTEQHQPAQSHQLQHQQHSIQNSHHSQLQQYQFDSQASSRGVLTRSTSTSTLPQHDGVTHRNKNIPMVPQLKRWSAELKRAEDQSSYNSLQGSTTAAKRFYKNGPNSGASTAMSSMMAHNSMHSLVPMTVFEEKLSVYRSELDDDSDDYQHEYSTSNAGSNNHDLDESNAWISSVDNRSGVTSPTVNETAEFDNLDSIHDSLREIEKFQSNFVQSQKKTPDFFGSSRVQQKVLDYKELQEFQPIVSPLWNSLDYNMKIQNETITSQYTLLRLRFSGGNKMGVLGYIADRKWEATPTTPNQVTKENKDTHIQQLWDTEMKMFLTAAPRIPVLQTQNLERSSGNAASAARAISSAYSPISSVVAAPLATSGHGLGASATGPRLRLSIEVSADGSKNDREVQRPLSATEHYENINLSHSATPSLFSAGNLQPLGEHSAASPAVTKGSAYHEEGTFGIAEYEAFHGQVQDL